MKMTRFNEPQILSILHQAEGSVQVAELYHSVMCVHK